jgi:hypothetical protein
MVIILLKVEMVEILCGILEKKKKKKFIKKHKKVLQKKKGNNEKKIYPRQTKII